MIAAERKLKKLLTKTVYFGRDGKTLVMLLGGGDKRRQAADIAAAVKRWRRYKERKNKTCPREIELAFS